MAIPDRPHDDWIWPFSLIHRRSNAIESDVPPKVVGTSMEEDRGKEIPDPGHWTLQASKYGFYFATTSKDRLHFRVGTFRYDRVDKYYTFPTASLKRLQGQPNEAQEPM